MTRQIIAVGGGKGGVGKSLVAANLAVAAAQAGASVVLVDADLGGANLHTLFGIDRPRALLEHFIAGKIAALDDAVMPAGVDGLGIVCGGMPLLGTANPRFTQKAKFIRHMRKLTADVVIIDVGAGTNFNTLDLFNAAEYKIATFVPQLTSLHNGYGFLKAAVHRLLSRLISPRAREHLQASNPEAGQDSLLRVIARVAGEEMGEAEKMGVILREQRIYLVGNMLRSDRDQNVVSALQQMIHDHLVIETEILGMLRYGEKLERSVNERRPFMLSAGIERNAETFRAMAQRLIRAHRAADARRSSRPANPAPAQDDAPSDDSYDRKEPRYPTPPIRAVLVDGEGGKFEGKLLNIAHGGVMAIFSESLPTPAGGILNIGPLRSGDAIAVQVEERRRIREDRRIGFSFIHPDDRTDAQIAALVAETAAELAVRRGVDGESPA